MYLFMFTIGPVKSFIENSRKVKDLYAGSKLLSELMQKAVKWLGDREVNVLFPIGQDNVKPTNMPNRLVAEFEPCSKDQLVETAEKLTGYLKQEFLTTSLALLENAGIEGHGLSMAKHQLLNYLEIYWLYEPYDEENFLMAYQKLFTSIHNVKSIRCFEQTEEPWGRKCMLFPEYNGIFAKLQDKHEKNVYPYNTNKDYVYDISHNKVFDYYVEEGETLSAIAMVKRVYNGGCPQIYSLRQMLLRSRIEQSLFEEADIRQSDLNLMDHTANVVYDLNNGNTWGDGDYPQEAIDQAKVLYKVIQEHNIQLSSYYGVLKFDGDSVGDKFRQLATKIEQQELSMNISKFASQAPDILLQHGGLPVFAGGEDFLGFLPLDKLFQCLKELYKEFHKVTGMTFSAGILIAHLMYPLKEVLSQVSEMEHAAKNTVGKASFSIGILIRSGANVRMPAYHLSNTLEGPVLEDLEKLIQLLIQTGCSKSLLYQVSNVMEHFIQKNIFPDNGMMEALLRKFMNGAYVDSTQASKEELLQKLLLFFRKASNEKDFLNTLNGIGFLSSEVAL